MEFWTRAETSQLIELYRECTCLWNHKDPNFNNRDKREAMYAYIVERMNNIKPNLTQKSIRTKMRTLQSQMSREKRIINEQIQSGTAENKKCRLWCYDELQFLSNSIESRKKSNLETHIILSSSCNNNNQYDSESDNRTCDIKAEVNDDANRSETYGNLCLSGLSDETNQNSATALSKASSTTASSVITKNYNHFNPQQYANIKHESIKCGVGGGGGGTVIDSNVLQSMFNCNREEDFCRFLCSELKNIRSEENFDDVKYEILNLVRGAIKKDRAMRNETGVMHPFQCLRTEYNTPELDSTVSNEANCANGKNYTEMDEL